MNDDQIIRLIEKRYEDIRHIETEQHWFLASYAVVIAGVLAFLTPNEKQSIYVTAFGILFVVSLVGLLHALRATKILHDVQRDAKNIVSRWSEEATDDSGRSWRQKWQWGDMASWKPEKGWVADLFWDLLNLVLFFLIPVGWLILLNSRWKRCLRERAMPSPPTFTTLGILAYILGAAFFLILFVVHLAMF